MHADFWHQKWEEKNIGFHLEATNPLLLAHVHRLGLRPGARLFLPLCGKTRDIAWLLEQGYRVVGAELSEIAISELFEELGWQPQITVGKALKHYQAESLDIFVGDIFELAEAQLGSVDAIYDRAALVALPENSRCNYAAHLQTLCPGVPHLLLTYEYDQTLRKGPPFSVSAAELAQLYPDYQQEVIAQQAAKGFQGQIPTCETVWLLR